MRVHHEYDFLLANRAPENRRDEFGLGGRPGPADAAAARAALREDSRVDVRVRAVMLLSDAEQEHAIADFVAALDDPATEVIAAAANALVENGTAYMDRPESPEALGALRSHAARLRAIAAGPGPADGPWRPRYDAAEALVFIADKQSLPMLLTDKDLVRLGLDLASKVRLEPADVKLLASLAAKGPTALGPIRVLVDRAPETGLPLLVAAIGRGDADAGFADDVVDHNVTAAVPGILALIGRTPRDISVAPWIDALGKLHATCAASAIADVNEEGILKIYASSALAQLSGHPDWDDAKLVAWAKAQASDAPPCTARRLLSNRRTRP